MKRRYYQLLLLVLSGLLSLMGTAGCKTLKIGRKAAKKQQQAYIDSIAKAQIMEAYKRDSIEQAILRQEFIKDSIRRAEELERTKNIYGGPNMMGRRFKNQKKSE